MRLMKRYVKDQPDDQPDTRGYLLQLCFEVLHTSGFYDEPKDETRTMANMELSTIVYVDECIPKMKNWPIWVESKKDPNKRIGVEQHFDVVLTFHSPEDKQLFGTIPYKVEQFRIIGTIDGAVVKAATKNIHIDENKTAVRLDRGWRDSFDMSHQLTNYCACSSIVFGFPIDRTRITGLKIKPSGRGDDIYVAEPLQRNSTMVHHWANWVYDRARTFEAYSANFEEAPRFTHSCNRYFRPCSLLSFCGDTPDGRVAQWEQMVPSSKTPSERAVVDG